MFVWKEFQRFTYGHFSDKYNKKDFRRYKVLFLFGIIPLYVNVKIEKLRGGV